MTVSAPNFDPTATMHDVDMEPEMTDCKTYESVAKMVITHF